MNRKHFKFLCFLLGITLTFNFKAYTQPCVGSTSFTINPQPTGGGYAPGTVVTYCYTVNNY